MSEHIHDQVSAFLDDELSTEQCAFLVRRFERDPEARGKLARYALIGSALRGELGLAGPDTLRQRIHDAIGDGESAASDAGRSTGAVAAAAAAAPAEAVPAAARAAWARPSVGIGIAASVALAAVFGARFMIGPGTENAEPGPQIASSAASASSAVSASTASAPASGSAAVTSGPSTVVPSRFQPARVTSPPPMRLTNYLLHHGEYASGLGRTSVHSNVVGADSALMIEPVVYDDTPPATTPASAQ